MRWLICLAVVLGGCAATGESKKLFGRTDCRRHADHPKLERDFERISTVCVGRAKAAAAAGSASTYNMRSAIAGGVAQALIESKIINSTMLSCMAEHGYLYKTRPEHKAACGGK